MLRYLRENTGNWIIKMFLAIIVVVFVFLGVGSFGSKRNNVVATVNDEPITIKEFQNAYKAMINQLQARFGKSLNDDLIEALNVKQQALDALIEEKLVLAEADRLEIQISDQELQNFLMSVKAFQKDGQFDITLYKRVLGQNSLNPEIFEAMQIDQMRQQKVKNLIAGTVTVSDVEARQFYLFQNTQKAVDYVGFIPANYSDIQVTDQQIQEHYEANKENYQSNPKLKAEYVKFSPDDYKDAVAVKADQIKNYYEQHINEYEIPEKVEARHILIKVGEQADEETVSEAEKKAMEIYQKAFKGDDFEKLAKEFSEGPSASKGGYLGVFEKQMMVKPFADAAFAMKSGEISKPVRTQFGFHVIKLMNKFEARTQEFAEVEQKIKDQLVKQATADMAYDKAGEGFDAVIDGDDLAQVGLSFGKSIVKTEEFEEDGKGLSIPGARDFAKAAFDLQSDDISDIMQIGDSYYLIKVVQRIEPAVQPLDNVKALVKTNILNDLQKEQALKDARAFLSKAAEQKSISDIPVPGGAISKTTPLFSRNGPVDGIQDSAAFIEAAFSLSSTDQVYQDVVETASGYYVLALKEIQKPADSEITANLDDLENQLAWQKQSQAYTAWVADLRKNNEVTVEQSFFN